MCGARLRERLVQVRALEIHLGQRHTRLHAPLEQQQLDLQIGGRRQIRLVFLQPPQLLHFARFGPLRGRTFHRGDSSKTEGGRQKTEGVRMAG